MTMIGATRNRLAQASSPYLRQHANNPVHWQPWDEATLAHARATDTPILLSIGYSACHWCHVMARECFEDTAIAAAMNTAFVNIKLDREERPDIDRVYQSAHQAMSGRGGGWPLTAFLDPQDLSPFFIGTYFPPTPRHGLPGFPEVLRRVRTYFDGHRDELRAQAVELRTWMQGDPPHTRDALPDLARAEDLALQRALARFDPQQGGNRGAPKFPQPTQLEWQLGLPASEAQRMATLTLTRMAARGLQDHLGGGFFRYCVDAAWTIPHFEKMLYDNAQLLPVYARAAVVPTTDATDRDAARAAAIGIIDWLERDMTAPDGTLYSALDADSDHAEGAYYVWTRAQFDAVLDADDHAFAQAAFGLAAPPNFEHHAWHLLRDVPIDALATRFHATPADAAARLATIRATLLASRTPRTRPATDDKRLTAWNALAISGLLRTARLLDDGRAEALGLRALAGLRAGAWIDGELYANIAAADARIPGFLDDHAFLLDALIERLQTTFSADDFAWATTLADALLARFEDRAGGGFRFSTPAHATPLPQRRDWHDEALPNGNAVAIRALLRLGHLGGETRWIDAAERALHAAADALDRHPDACPTLLRALREFERPRLRIVIRCAEAHAPQWRAALREARQAIPASAGDDTLDAYVISDAATGLPDALTALTARGALGNAYLCSGLACRAPLDAPAALADAVRAALIDAA